MKQTLDKEIAAVKLSNKATYGPPSESKFESTCWMIKNKWKTVARRVNLYTYLKTSLDL